MGKVLSILLHPVTYFRLKKKQEHALLLAVACLACKIEEPTVWDVDNLHKAVNKYLEAIHIDSTMLDGLGHMKESLFWHRLLSKLKKVELKREDIKEAIDNYAFLRSLLSSRDIDSSPTGAAVVLNAAVKMFET